MDWFRTGVRDLIAGILTGAFLEAILEIDPFWGKLIATILAVGDYIAYLATGINVVNWIMDK